ncbi:eukaryotic rRNA processing protein EBP2-domain-containing protein, partial [Mycena epipterygia]
MSSRSHQNQDEDEDAGSDSDNSGEANDGEGSEGSNSGDDEENEEPVEEGEEDVALDDVESVDDDVVPRQKIETDNTAIEVDVNDDLNRELALRSMATAGRALAEKHSFPFTRPTDYFAEMVKSDAHMERIRQRLLDESAGIKKSDEKRKDREGKKLGKQVQIEKLKEREKGKKEMEERLKGLKPKRGDMLDKPTVDDDAFDIAVEDAISGHPVKRGRGAAPGGRGERGGSKVTRQARDSKYGFGGAGKRSKSNTRESTDYFDDSKWGGDRGGRGRTRSSFRGFSRGGSRGGGTAVPFLEKSYQSGHLRVDTGLLPAEQRARKPADDSTR